MFEREVLKQLSAWKVDEKRKPLVIHGAGFLHIPLFLADKTQDLLEMQTFS